MSDRLYHLAQIHSYASFGSAVRPIDAGLPDIRNLFDEPEQEVSDEQLKSLFDEEVEGDVVPRYVSPESLTPLQPAPAKPAYTEVSDGQDLRVGHRGERVREVQKKLQDKGYRLSFRNGSPDGIFGKGTKNAVIYFQVLNEVHPANGIVNQATLSKLNSGNFIGPSDTKDPPPGRERLQYTEEDVEAAARGLVVETGFRHSYDELAAIVWVMINRSKRWGISIKEVIHPDTGGGRNWYGGLSPNNRKRWHAASKRKDFEYIKGFVRKIFEGASFENPIGNRAHFLHPTGMPECHGEPGSPCGSRNHRLCVDTVWYGKRCLPKWNVDGNTNMAGRVNVENIGRARFS